MTISKHAGKVQTVLGLIEPDDLGTTLTHEHLFLDHRNANFVEPEEATNKAMAYRPVSMETLHWLRYHHTQNLDNMCLNDEQQAIDEVTLYKRAGGDSIVDVTNWGAGRDPEALVRLSRATGLNVVMGSGYYLAGSHPKDMGEKSEETITEEIVKEFTEGAGNTGVFPGLIGEIGCSWPLTPNEKRSLKASAKAQRLTGAPLSVHPGRKNNEAALEIVRILRASGADMSRVIMCHIDVRVRDHKVRCQIGKTGCYLEYDVFGWEGLAPLSLYQNSDIDIPNDVQRIFEIKSLIEEGYLNQILISQDICYKTWRACYGGPGYSHIMKYIIPLMLRKGITKDQIKTMTVDNPKRLLTLQ